MSPENPPLEKGSLIPYFTRKNEIPDKGEAFEVISPASTNLSLNCAEKGLSGWRMKEIFLLSNTPRGRKLLKSSFGFRHGIGIMRANAPSFHKWGEEGKGGGALYHVAY